MNFTLKRTEFSSNGIFGTLISEDGKQTFVTLEHSYPLLNGKCAPKLPAGTFQCVRGEHTLEHCPAPFETFEVQNVPGHKGILLHRGNWQNDSSGCVLVGESRVGDMILNSREAFQAFMEAQSGVQEFTLVVL